MTVRTQQDTLQHFFSDHLPTFLRYIPYLKVLITTMVKLKARLIEDLTTIRALSTQEGYGCFFEKIPSDLLTTRRTDTPYTGLTAKSAFVGHVNTVR